MNFFKLVIASIIRRKICPACGAFMAKNAEGTLYICPRCGNQLPV